MGCGPSTPSNSKEITPNYKRKKMRKSLNDAKFSTVSIEKHLDLCKKKLFPSSHLNNNLINKPDNNAKVIKSDATSLSSKSLIILPLFGFEIHNPTNNFSLPNSFKYANWKSLKNKKDSENNSPKCPKSLYSDVIVKIKGNKEKKKETTPINTEINIKKKVNSAHQLMHSPLSFVSLKKDEDTLDTLSDQASIRSTASPKNLFCLKGPKSPQMCNFFLFLIINKILLIF